MATALLPKPKTTTTTALATIPEPARIDESLTYISTDLIDIGENVRRTVGDVDELAASIAQVGLLQAVKVLGPFPDTGRYSLIYGQRRLTAVRQLGWKGIKAVVVAPGALGTDARTQRVVEQLLENSQREGLAPLETAAALKVLVAQIGSQAETARQLGKSEGWVSSTLKLLDAAPTVQELVSEGKLTASHAEAIASLSKADQAQMATNAVNSGWTARHLEEEVAWYRERAESRASEDARQATKRAEASKRIVADLIKKSAVKADPIKVSGDRPGWTVDLLRKAGYTAVTEYRGYGESPPGPEFCTCRAWHIRVSYDGGLTLGRDCVVKAHAAAADKARNAKSSAKMATEHEAREAIALALKLERDRLKGLGPLTLRVLASSLMRWSLDQWSEGRAKASRKRDRNWLALRDAPDTELIDLIVKYLRLPSELSAIAVAADLERFGHGSEPNAAES